MRALVALLSVLPLAAQADVLICEFTPDTCPPATHCAPFDIIIDTHHATDAPFFSYDGHTAPIIEITPEGGLAESYVTLGSADREIVTLFSGTDAIHTRHYTVDGAPVALTSTGGCFSFY